MNDIATHILVPNDHPSLAGHFPGHPIVPGVVLLDAVLDAIRSSLTGRSSPNAAKRMDARELPDGAVRLVAIVSTKFLQAVAPDQRVDLEIKFAAQDAGQWKARFVATTGGATVLEGSFLIASDTPVGAAR
jgi:3-hydroxymyristoyl/3-hydroxydecanoyl-(acyl carrier protein) dehydratase